MLLKRLLYSWALHYAIEHDHAVAFVVAPIGCKSIGPFGPISSGRLGLRNHWQCHSASVLGAQRSASVALESSPSYRRGWKVKDCQSIEELMQIATDNIDGLSSNTIAAVWSSIPRLISTRTANHSHGGKKNITTDTQQSKHRITTILRRTAYLQSRMGSKDLTTVILGMAKTVKNVREAKQRRRMNIYQQSFGNVFLDDNSTVQTSIFQPLAKRANDILLDYDARYLANLAYAHALLGFDPKFEDGSTLMGKIAVASIRRVEDFDPQNLSNTVWAYATMNVKHSALFMKIGNSIVKLKDLKSFEPQALSNTVWAFATANIEHPGLLMKVGSAIVDSKDLKSFNPQNLANTVWAFATFNIQHHGLFKTIGNAIVELKDLKSFNAQDLSNTLWAYATAT
jgi:hypothetical protein